MVCSIVLFSAWLDKVFWILHCCIYLDFQFISIDQCETITCSLCRCTLDRSSNCWYCFMSFFSSTNHSVEKFGCTVFLKAQRFTIQVGLSFSKGFCARRSSWWNKWSCWFYIPRQKNTSRFYASIWCSSSRSSISVLEVAITR